MANALTKKAQTRGIDTRGIDTRLQGRQLLIVRIVWLVVAIFNLALGILNLLQPIFGGKIIMCPLALTCAPYDTPTLQALSQAHISLAAYDVYVTSFGLLYVLIFLGLSLLLFLRMFDQRIGLLASFTFLLMASNSLSGNTTMLPTSFGLIASFILTNCLLLCLGFFFVTFPDGRFVPRWSWLIGCTLFVQAIFFQLPPPLNILSWPFPLIVIELVLAYSSPIVIQIYRYRRVSNLVQRQQTKWVFFGLVSFLLCFFIGIFAGSLFPTWGLYQLAIESLPSFAFLIIPVSVMFAIQRSRLWDLDAIIKRTLVYGLLTLILALIYFGLVFGAQHLLSGFIDKQNGIEIVGSTLIVAALFRPLLRSIQNVIDRRFYRQKYDAQRTIQAFNATLQQEIDLAQLSEHLVLVLQETMQPIHISLWLFAASERVTVPDIGQEG